MFETSRKHILLEELTSEYETKEKYFNPDKVVHR